MIRAGCIGLFLLLTDAATADPRALDIVNALRAEAGGHALTYAHRLETIAADHATVMARRGVTTHRGADGSGPDARARRRGYRFCRIAENVAQWYRSRNGVIAAWSRSPGHRRNLLDARVTEMGLARAEGDYWVLVLARPGC